MESILEELDKNLKRAATLNKKVAKHLRKKFKKESGLKELESGCGYKFWNKVNNRECSVEIILPGISDGPKFIVEHMITGPHEMGTIYFEPKDFEIKIEELIAFLKTGEKGWQKR